MNTLRIALISLGLLTASTAMAQDRLRVLDQGLDGNQRTYTITCPDGKLSSVVQHFDFDPSQEEQVSDVALRARTVTPASPPAIIKVCIYPYAGKEKCRANWKLDVAAQASCK